MKPRYTVIVITYNQEAFIGRAIESVLVQKEFVHEIVVSDDCSNDATWNIIQSYHERHPDLIRPFRNEKNLGIFAHIEATWQRTTGDIIFYLAGDDELCNGLFKKSNELIEREKIDYITNAVSLYFDYKQVTPEGREIIFRNNLITKFDPISLKIRDLICNRTVGFNRKVLEQFYPVNKEIGIFADGLIDIQVQLFSKKNYYSPFIGSVYYSGIGISSVTRLKKAYQSDLLLRKKLLLLVNSGSNHDKNWLNYLISRLTFLLEPGYKNYINYLISFFRGVNMKYGSSFYKREFKKLVKNTLKNWKFFLFLKTGLAKVD